MPNSLQSSAIASPASRRATNCSLSSITEHSFQGITPSPLQGKVSPMCPVQCVTYFSRRSVVIGTFHFFSSHAELRPNFLLKEFGITGGDCLPGEVFLLGRPV